MEKTLGILVFDDVLTSEVTAPAEVFGSASQKAWFQQWRIVMIGLESSAIVTTAEGLKIKPDLALRQAPQVDVLIVPGAHDLEQLSQSKQLIGYLENRGDSAQWVASNCSGAFLMAHAGILDGFQATTWFGGEAELAKKYPKVRVIYDRPVVIDRNRITSNGGLVSYDAAFVLLARLSSKAHAREIYEELQAQRLTPWSELAPLMEP